MKGTYLLYSHTCNVRFRDSLRKTLPLFLLILLSQRIFAQGEGNNWYFGANAGVTFNSGSPVAITTGALNTMEGCASISDPGGNLLFYTDGIFVWNKLNVQMPNGFGLFGNPSSTQSAIIVPRPGNPNIYYIFTVDACGVGNGCNYSVVDMTMQGGNGDVTLKNLPLISPTAEKVTAVKASNGSDIWVVTHEYNTNNFYSYKVTSGGVNTTAVISSVGTIPTGGCGNSIGYMKISSNGQWLAQAIRYYNAIELYSFNNTTGAVSNPILFPTIYNYPYGIEFSPDNSKLYFTTNLTGDYLYQSDLSSGVPATIIASTVQIGNSNVGYALQQGPDGKIYCSCYTSSFLGVVNNPNMAGVACNYVAAGVSLNGHTCNLGLPDFITSLFFPQTFTWQHDCFGDSTEFVLSDTTHIDSLFWNFGDPNTGAANLSQLIFPFHIYSDTGNFPVRLISWYAGAADTVYDTLHINPVLHLFLGNDTTICNGSTISLNATNSGTSGYLWQDGSTNPTFIVTQAGTYWCEINNMCGVVADTIVVNYLPPPVVNLGNDTTICPGQSLLLNGGSGFAGYQWQNGSVAQTFTAPDSGTYWVHVTSQLTCPGGDTIHIAYFNTNKPFIGNDTSFCPGGSITYSIGAGYSNYTWQNNHNTTSFTATSPGTYWVHADDANGCPVGDTARVISIYPVPPVHVVNDSILCPGVMITLTAPSGYSYLWTDGSAQQTFTVAWPGPYSVILTNGFGCQSESDFVIGSDCPGGLYFPSAFTPNDDGLNDQFKPHYYHIASYNLKIFNRWGQLIYETDRISEGWDGTFNGLKCEMGTYVYEASFTDDSNHPSTQQVKGDVTLIR